ncbi:MAG: N-acetylmuramoyl-L-alanine amidase [Firmicutes bacterium]|nr:N-acetylmuramoyl-L-alanine amidase [[Eubacterium] siraeum]MCM1487622.1 N-acetylmuramoyl-L-alanine amidase [Bacillota bacterium]
MKTKIPHTFVFLTCFIVAALAISFRNGTVPAVSASVTEGKRTVVIDSGHGGADGGCVGVNGCVEKDINLAIAKDLEALLKLSGFNVVMTRSEDVSIHSEGVEGLRNQKVSDMENRLGIIKSYPDAMFISIHQNQYTEPEYFGAQMFYTTNNTGNFKLAQLMQESFRELQPENDREIKLIDNDLYLFKNTDQPAILAECGFLSNSNDAANLSDSEYQKKVAFTIYKGVMRYYNSADAANVQITGEGNGENENILYMQ